MKKNSEADIIDELVNHLKMLRLKQGLSHNKLSLKSGVTRPAISLIERGKRTPTLVVCLKLSHALGKSLGELLIKCERDSHK